MNYKYIPNTYNMNKILEKKLTYEDFFKYQLIYRKSFENWLQQIINFTNIDEYIQKLGINIPIIKDKSYNFYHKYSSLKSNYVYLRNNFHIENLSDEELITLKKCENEKKLLSKIFLENTYQKVIFENGNKIFFGIPVLKNEVNSKSIIFEFCYNINEITNNDKITDIEEVYKKIFFLIEKIIKQELKISSSMLIYDFVTDLFINENQNYELTNIDIE